MTSVLVAGGATGIGAAVVRSFRGAGATVTLADRNVDAGGALVAEPGPGAARFIECDLSDTAAPAEAVAAAVEFGGGVDVVFYNAGVLQARALADWTVEDWDLAAAVNLRGPFLMAQAAQAALSASEHGRFIVTASTGALRGHAGMPAYHATKSGVLGLVRALADEFGPAGVTVNAVCPGWVDTTFNDGFWSHQDDPDAALQRLVDSIPLRRQAVPDDVSGLVLFLATPAASYITGQALVVDGGYTAV
ncbi:SDR family NAD(P)-dependent oxidoreductase [Ruicaihuangia caeni]|uniref:SDR family NAD(P)-dependent oxidoreductase n=1 Tax=Ruicaihuangia caeni TaxID=3042517 RepID=UPI00338EAC8B